MAICGTPTGAKALSSFTDGPAGGLLSTFCICLVEHWLRGGAGLATGSAVAFLHLGRPADATLCPWTAQNIVLLGCDYTSRIVAMAGGLPECTLLV